MGWDKWKIKLFWDQDSVLLGTSGYHRKAGFLNRVMSLKILTGKGVKAVPKYVKGVTDHLWLNIRKYSVASAVIN